MITAKRILPLIVVSQFLCTSLWFAGNAIIYDLVVSFNIEPNAIGQLTSSVQLGFIIGTLLFAVLMITDRYSPVSVFFISAVFGALFNLGMVWENNNLLSLTIFRFLTGICLAGIYPVGMKIASDYFDEGLGKSLGYLVGALVLGTALPHLLKATSFDFNWQWVVIGTSGLAVIGGLAIGLAVPNGPNRKKSQEIEWRAFFKVFKQANFRSAAFGYFGHMWELYAFWAFVPAILLTYQEIHDLTSLNISWFSFLIIGVGSLGCVWSGYLSQTKGPKTVARLALSISGICCLISPLMFYQPSFSFLILFLIIWGLTVVADSPLFSTLVAQNVPTDKKGTALTIVNCIGFAVTIVSIQLINWLLANHLAEFAYVFLAIGPVFGIIGILKK
ncbi:MFS transporter [Reichenbachiella sp.]